MGMAAIRTASWGCVTKSLHVRYERCAPEMQMLPCRLAPASTHAHTHACVLARTRLRSFLKPVPIDSVVEFKLVGVTRQRDGRFARTHAPARSRVRYACDVPGQHVACYLPQDDCDACALPAQRYARLRRPPSQPHWRVERRRIWLSRRRCALPPAVVSMHLRAPRMRLHAPRSHPRKTLQEAKAVFVRLLPCDMSYSQAASLMGKHVPDDDARRNLREWTAAPRTRL